METQNMVIAKYHIPSYDLNNQTNIVIATGKVIKVDVTPDENGFYFKEIAFPPSITSSENRFDLSIMNHNCVEIIIPKEVRSLSDFLFMGCASLKRIDLAVGLETIGERCFSECVSLKQITIPSSVRYLGKGAFNGCENLEEITLPDGIKEIPERFLADCKRLKRIIIPNSVTSIKEAAFAGCENLQEIVLPNSIQQMGPQVFLNCKKLKSVTLPASLKVLPKATFKGCKALTNHCLPESIEAIEDYAFAGCKRLIKYPTHIKKMGEAAFLGCTSLKTVNINSNMTSLPNGAFACCSLLENITGPDMSIGEHVFANCSSLQEVPTFVKTYGNFAFKNCSKIIVVNNTQEKIPAGAFLGCTNLEKVNGSEKAKEIGGGAFNGCIKLKNFTFSDSLQTINREAFFNCQSLEDISFPDNLKIIGSDAFNGCVSFKEINLPSSLETIKDQAFMNCHLVKELIIKDNLKDIGLKSFYNMRQLGEISVSFLNNYYMTTDDHLVLLSKNHTLILYAIGSPNKSYSLAGSYCYKEDTIEQELISPITNIGPYAFANAQNLEELVLASCTSDIEITAFENCPNLKKLKIKGIPLFNSAGIRLRQLGQHFEEDVTLPFERVVVSGYVNYLHDRSFWGFKNLKTVELPKDSLLMIGSNVFTDCPLLKEIFIPNSVSKISSEAFNNKTKIVFESGLKTSGESFLSLSKQNNTRIFKFKRNYYLLESQTGRRRVTYKEIKEACNNATHIINQPDKYVAYYDYLKKLNITDPFLFNGRFMNVISNEQMHSLFDNYDAVSSLVIKTSRLLLGDEDTEINENLTLFTSHNIDKLINYINLIRKYGYDDKSVLNGLLIILVDKDNAEQLIKNYNANLKRLIKESKVFDIGFTAKDNVNDLLKLANALGVFEEDSITKQRACTFIVEKLFAEKLPNGKSNIYRTVGDDIHRRFNLLEVRKFDPKFVNFFMDNFDQIMSTEDSLPGFIERVYNNFEKISKTNTSNKGLQRQLVVTIDKCIDFFCKNKFDGVTPKTQHIANLLGFWFNDQLSFHIGVTVFNEAKKAPRNIFTKFKLVRGKAVFDNSESNDLREEINENYSYEWLPKQDINNLILGKKCNCCAHVSGAGAGIMRASMISPDCQNLIIRDDIGEIIAKATINVNRDRQYAIFNNVESASSQRTEEANKKIYETFMRGATAFSDTYNKNNPHKNLAIISIGTGMNTIIDQFKKEGDKHPLLKEALEPIDYSTFAIENRGLYIGNAKEQVLVLQKTK